jgi:hypothetical protein
MNKKIKFPPVLLGLLAAGTLPIAGAPINSYPPQLAVFSAAKEQ